MCSKLQENVNLPSDTLQPLIVSLRSQANGIDFGVTPKLDDAFLTRFLRVRNRDVEKALKSLEAYYRNVDLHRDFDGIRPLDYENAFSSRIISLLRGRSEGRRVLVLRTSLWNPPEVSLRELQLTTFFHVEYSSLETETQEQGLVLIFDMHGIALKHMRQLTFHEIKRSINAAQNGLAIKVKEIHCINTPLILKPLIHLTHNFLTKKLRERMYIHSGIGNLDKFIHPTILPASFGGQVDDEICYDGEFINKILEENMVTDDFWKGGEDCSLLVIDGAEFCFP